MSPSSPEGDEALRVAYETVCARVRQSALRSGRGAESVTLIAVSKKQPLHRVAALYRLGHRDFGENYVQEMLEKAELLESQGYAGIRWHFIGHLQSNKVKSVIRAAHAIHAVDSEKLARELARRMRERLQGGSEPPLRRLPIFIEINLGSEPNKSGILAGEAPELALQVSQFEELELRGLMCVPEADLNPPQLKTRFLELRDLERQCRPYSAGDLSMGMSSDFELAIAQGATHVRVGTALFGERRPLRLD